jgi:DNA topoisomerase-1
MTILLIVESPSKCKKIESYLGKNYKCIASFGHICKLTKINKDNDYEPIFEIIPEKKKHIKFLCDSIKKADEVILATDDDREGEAIAWHICRIGKLPLTTKRIIFHEITQTALQNAVQTPTTIDMKKVNSQLARQVLDLIVGFSISPILWKQFFHSIGKNNGLSAGRCQTPALRLVYENKVEIDNEPGDMIFETTGIFTEKNLEFKLNKQIKDKEEMETFLNDSVNYNHLIKKSADPIKKTRNAPLPFSTSSLQQRASNELHYSPKRTMQLAQKLYEAGHITYMRTDNKKYSKDFIKETQNYIKKTWKCNNDYLRTNYNSIVIGKSKTKDTTAQEAHEAIRPTRITSRDVDMPVGEKKLYKLIWETTIESCMANCIYNLLTIEISAPNNFLYKNNQEQIIFPGWLLVKGFIKDNHIYNYLFSLREQEVEYSKILSNQSLKNLKSHYTEAKLVQTLEKRGIGRPSTFSSLIDKIQERLYVKKENVTGVEVECCEYILKKRFLEEKTVLKTFGNEKNKLVLQPLGRFVVEFLLSKFDNIFEYDYTSNMEEELDNISQGNGDWKQLCRDCDNIIGEKIKIIKSQKQEKGIKLDDNHTFMVGKYGPVVKYEKNNVITYKNVKKNLNIDKMLGGNLNIESIIENEFCERVLGEHDSNDVVLKKGRYGLYISCNGKNHSLKGIEKNEDEITLEDVIDIVSGKKSTNPNIIKILNENCSVRKGKYGQYIFYKTKNMSKPKFIQLKKVFEHEDDKNWENYSPAAIVGLIQENCL